MRSIIHWLVVAALVLVSSTSEARWLSVDPVEANANNGQNFNRYYYANNNPYRFTDPDGRAPQDGLAAERAYGASASMNMTPDQRRIWEAGERAATTQGRGAIEGAGMMDSLRAFVANPSFSKEGVARLAVSLAIIRITHGNSRFDMRAQHRYVLKDAGGDVVKTGISGRPLNLDGSSPRANSQVNALNRTEGPGSYTANVVERNIPGRASALDSERAATRSLRAEGNTLRLQQRPKPDP